MAKDKKLTDVEIQKLKDIKTKQVKEQETVKK